MLKQRPYSTDLVPKDYYFFRNLKFVLENIFPSNGEVISVVAQYFADFPENHYRDGVKLLRDQWNGYFELNGDYIE